MAPPSAAAGAVGGGGFLGLATACHPNKNFGSERRQPDRTFHVFSPNAAPGIFGGYTFTGNNRHIHLLTAGINYKFAPWWNASLLLHGRCPVPLTR
jgi:hypothetical protein